MEKKSQQQKQNEREMAEYIFSILKSQKPIIWSWGANSFASENGNLIFRVNGFKHKGLVRVRYNRGKDLFEVELAIKGGRVIKLFTDVYFDELVNVIDSAVETDNDQSETYKRNVSKFLKGGKI